MSYKVEEIEGIGPTYQELLNRAGIVTTEDLLARCGAPKGRDDLAATTEIDAARLLAWTNMADLMRISGIGRQYAELLEAVGVDTVRELATRDPDKLAKSMRTTNHERRLAKSSPSATQTQEWIAQAKELPRAITY